jgi:hypothetical protein
MRGREYMLNIDASKLTMLLQGEFVDARHLFGRDHTFQHLSPGLTMHDGGVTVVSRQHGTGDDQLRPYETIPPSAIAMPNRLPLLKESPLKIQLSRIIRQVLKCPTTVLLTGPASWTMMNCVVVMRHARPPL